MDLLPKLISDIEILSPEGIRDCFENGIDPNSIYRSRPLINELIGGYARGPEFRECVRVFTDHGLVFNDRALLAVLLDDAISLDNLLQKDAGILSGKYNLQTAFTPLHQASLLHICAEFNHVATAEVLIKHGADINSLAGTDENGFGGQSPIFHTVNQHELNGLEVMKFLLAHSADLQITLKGIIWGKGYQWETFIPAVNPISYAMMGLLRQFQRKEKQVYEVVSILMEAAFGMKYYPSNVPNKYL